MAKYYLVRALCIVPDNTFDAEEELDGGIEGYITDSVHDAVAYGGECVPGSPYVREGDGIVDVKYLGEIPDVSTILSRRSGV